MKNIAKTEAIPLSELENIPGSGENNRLTKSDLLAYVEQRKNSPQTTFNEAKPNKKTPPHQQKSISKQLQMVKIN